MSGKKNLHEGNILYFSLKVCKKTGTKKSAKRFGKLCVPLKNPGYAPVLEIKVFSIKWGD